MMSSVIPARLQFQCGHAALVTLPRVKGESAAQRNDRVAREKTAALGRQCDFCAPSVAVLDTQLAAVNGNYGGEADMPTPTANLTVLIPDESDTPSEPEPTSSEADAEPVVASAEPVVLEPEPREPEVPEEVVVEAIIESRVEEEEAEEEAPAPAPEPKRARGPRARRQPAPAAPPAAPARRARRAPARRATRRPAPAVSTQRFLVEYQVERVIRAATLQDALRQVNALGASDVLGITRED
jgi:hypothetical protein